MDRRQFLSALGTAAGAALSGCIASTCTDGYQLALRPTTRSEILLNNYRRLNQFNDPSYRRYVLSQFLDNPTETQYKGFVSGSLRGGTLVEINDTFYETATPIERRTGKTYEYDITTTDEIPSGQEILRLSDLPSRDKEAILYNNPTIIPRVNGNPSDVNAFFNNNDITATFEYVDDAVDDGRFTGEAPLYLELGDFVFALTAPQSRGDTYSITTMTLDEVATTRAEAEAYVLETRGVRLDDSGLTEDDKVVLDRAIGQRPTTVCTKAEDSQDVSERQLSSSTRQKLANRDDNKYVRYDGEWYRILYRDSTSLP